MLERVRFRIGFAAMPNRIDQIIASTFLWVLLSACAGSPPASTPEIAPNDLSSVTITYWHAETGPAAALLDSLADDFHQKYPAITLAGDAKKDEGELLRLGIAAIATNQPPDLIIANRRTLAEFARRNGLIPLDPFLNDPSLGLSPQDRSDFVPGLLDAVRFPDLKNALYSFPFDENAVVLFYNRDLLQAAQVAVPPTTWDQFNAAALATTKGSVRGWAMWPDAATFYAFLFSRGSSPLNDAQTEIQFGDDAGVKSLQMIAVLSQSGSAYLVETGAAARADFVQGRTALFFGTTDDLGPVSNAIAAIHAPFQWGVSNVPQNDPAHPVVVISGADVGIFAQSSERARAAWLFARWLAEPAQTARWAGATLSLPLRVSALPLLADTTPSPLLQQLRVGLGDAPPTVRSVPATKSAAPLDAAVTNMWISVANGADPTAAINSAVTQVNRYFSP